MIDKRGTGILTLAADSTSFTGTTTVNAGTLAVNGSLGGTLDVLSGARLQGAGTVGTTTVATSGTIAPGNSIGTLTVDGDLILAAGSRFEIEVNPEGIDSDLVKVRGTATLDGGTVAHIGANGNYDIRSTYTILSAGVLNGAFEGVTSDFAFLTPNLIYDFAAGTVDLELARNNRDFAAAALTRNQIATANGIESIGFDGGHDVYDAIAQLADDEDLIRASFDALSGEIHASAKSALIENSHFIRDAVYDRLGAVFEGAGAQAVPVLAYDEGGPVLAFATTDRFAAWGTAFGSWGSIDGDGNAASLDTSTGGLLTGIDGLVAENVRLGILTGYSHISFDADSRTSSGSSNNYHLGLYGGTQRGALAVRSGLAYTWHDIETSRSVVMPGFADSLSSDYNAGTFQAFGELGYSIDTPAASFEPFFNLAYVNLHTDGFTEKGDAAALTSHGETTDTTFTTLGLRGSAGFVLGTVKATARGMLGWRCLHSRRRTDRERCRPYQYRPRFQSDRCRNPRYRLSGSVRLRRPAERLQRKTRGEVLSIKRERFGECISSARCQHIGDIQPGHP
ncbi:MAG: autotransporter outer membrane beta-barrel domain-containing protein [Phyllobacterium sp.]